MPDPEYDAITTIFMLTNNDVPAGSKRPKQYEGKPMEPTIYPSHYKFGNHLEIFVLDPDFEARQQELLASSGVFRDNIRYFSSEKALILGFVEAVQVRQRQ